MKINHYHYKSLAILFFLAVTFTSRSQQVTIVSANVNSYNVSPKGLCEVTIMSSLPSVQAIMQVQLLDAVNEPLVTVKTNEFSLHNGLNLAANISFSISDVEYGASSVSAYIRNTNMLPEGKYNYCVKLTVFGNVESGDEYCQELQSDVNSYLYLVSPEDKDTVDTPNPLLIWNHSDPFGTLTQGQYYRMIVSPLERDQSAEEAITVNAPDYVKNNLEENQVQYPYDATNLEPGKHYAWQVLLISNDAVINKTEAWEFVEPIHVEAKDVKYAVLKLKVDGSFYPVVNNRIFFKFDEAYATNDVAECVIYDTRMHPVKSKTQDASKSDIAVALKREGYNQYEVDLSNMNVSSGFYYLKIKNGKGQSFMLKFLVN